MIPVHLGESGVAAPAEIDSLETSHELKLRCRDGEMYLSPPRQ